MLVWLIRQIIITWNFLLFTLSKKNDSVSQFVTLYFQYNSVRGMSPSYFYVFPMSRM